jgi:NADH-quinone oxidoreductase subunit N
VVAAFFYLRIVVLMFMRDPEGEAETDRSALPQIVVGVAAAAVVVFGLFPGIITTFLDQAAILRW